MTPSAAAVASGPCATQLAPQQAAAAQEEEQQQQQRPFRVGLLAFPNFTQLDMTGPFEVFSRMPGAQVLVIARTRDPVTSDRGLAVLPTATFDEVGF